MDSLLDTAPCGFLSFSDDGTILASNATLRKWLGCAEGALIGQSVEKLLPVASRIFYQTHFFPLLKIANEVEEVYMTLRPTQGSDLPVLVNAVRRTQEGVAVNDCVFMVVHQRSRYEDEILQARRTAEEARLWLSTTLQSIGDAVIATDAEGKIVFLNPVAEALTGWRQSEALGRPLDEIFIIFNEETGLSVESPVAKVLREKRVVGLANHTILISRDGTHCPIDDSGAPIRSLSGEILGVVLVFRDFTERQTAEKALREQQVQIVALNHHLQRAMTETHHRVKNNLQVISALVDIQLQTGGEIVPSSELVRLSQHIRGLAVIHDLLTHQTKQGGEAERLSTCATLDRLVPLLDGMTCGRPLHYHCTDILLPIRHVTSLAVLANELVSNATKHGSGEIGMSFTVEGNRGVLAVVDDGPGFPPDFDPTTTANTGMELVETISRFDLRGDIAFLNRPGGGASVRVTFPIETEGEAVS